MSLGEKVKVIGVLEIEIINLMILLNKCSWCIIVYLLIIFRGNGKYIIIFVFY